MNEEKLNNMRKVWTPQTAIDKQVELESQIEWSLTPEVRQLAPDRWPKVKTPPLTAVYSFVLSCMP